MVFECILDTGIYLHSTHEYLKDFDSCSKLIQKCKDQKILSPEKVFSEIKHEHYEINKLIQTVIADSEYKIDGPNIPVGKYLDDHYSHRISGSSEFIKNIFSCYKSNNPFRSLEHFVDYLRKIFSSMNKILELYRNKVIKENNNFIEKIRKITKEMKNNSPDALILSTFFGYCLQNISNLYAFATRDSRHILDNKLEFNQLFKELSGGKVNFDILHPELVLKKL